MQIAPAKPLGETVRDRRVSAGMTQGELAAASGLALSTVQNIESGRSTRVRRTTFRLIAEALGTDVASLLRDVA